MLGPARRLQAKKKLRASASILAIGGNVSNASQLGGAYLDNIVAFQDQRQDAADQSGLINPSKIGHLDSEIMLALLDVGLGFRRPVVFGDCLQSPTHLPDGRALSVSDRLQFVVSRLVSKLVAGGSGSATAIVSATPVIPTLGMALLWVQSAVTENGRVNANARDKPKPRLVAAAMTNYAFSERDMWNMVLALIQFMGRSGTTIHGRVTKGRITACKRFLEPLLRITRTVDYTQITKYLVIGSDPVASSAATLLRLMRGRANKHIQDSFLKQYAKRIGRGGVMRAWLGRALHVAAHYYPAYHRVHSYLQLAVGFIVITVYYPEKADQEVMRQTDELRHVPDPPVRKDFPNMLSWAKSVYVASGLSTDNMMTEAGSVNSPDLDSWKELHPYKVLAYYRFIRDRTRGSMAIRSLSCGWPRVYQLVAAFSSEMSGNSGVGNSFILLERIVREKDIKTLKTFVTIKGQKVYPCIVIWDYYYSELRLPNWPLAQKMDWSDPLASIRM